MLLQQYSTKMLAAKVAAAAATGAGAYYLATNKSSPVLGLTRPSVLAASGGHGPAVYDLTYYLKSALAGGICCSITHAAMTVSSPLLHLVSSPGLRIPC